MSSIRPSSKGGFHVVGHHASYPRPSNRRLVERQRAAPGGFPCVLHALCDRAHPAGRDCRGWNALRGGGRSRRDRRASTDSSAPRAARRSRRCAGATNRKDNIFAATIGSVTFVLADVRRLGRTRAARARRLRCRLARSSRSSPVRLASGITARFVASATRKCDAYPTDSPAARLRCEITAPACYDRTNVSRVHPTTRGVTLETNRGARVRARRVVVAAGYEVAKQLGRARGHLHSTWAVVSEPTCRPVLVARTMPDLGDATPLCLLANDRRWAGDDGRGR